MLHPILLRNTHSHCGDIHSPDTVSAQFREPHIYIWAVDDVMHNCLTHRRLVVLELHSNNAPLLVNFLPCVMDVLIHLDNDIRSNRLWINAVDIDLCPQVAVIFKRNLIHQHARQRIRDTELCDCSVYTACFVEVT